MRVFLLISTLSLVGCYAAPLEPAGSEPFARELAGRVAGPPQTCISTMPNQSLRIVDSATVAYEIGPTLWVNRLQQACPALSPYNNIIVERGGSQICRGDRVRGVEPGANIPGPACNLQDWVPYRLR